jgi:hypothetical protein
MTNQSQPPENQAEARERPALVTLALKLEEMRACESGMCMHCIDLLVLEIQPLITQLLTTEGHCPRHGYVDTSHRCAAYDGQPLSLLQQPVTSERSVRCVECKHVKLNPWRGHCEHQFGEFGKPVGYYCGHSCKTFEPVPAAGAGERERRDSAPSDVDELLFRLARRDCEHLSAHLNDCTEELPFVEWCVICQSRGLIQKYGRPPAPVAGGAQLCGICIAAGRVYCPPEHNMPSTATTNEAADAVIAMRAEWRSGAERAYAERDLSAEVRLCTKADAADEILTALQSLLDKKEGEDGPR